MNRKKTLLGLGLLYGICGIGAGAICYGQTQEMPMEVANVMEEMTASEVESETVSESVIETEQSQVMESTEEETQLPVETAEEIAEETTEMQEEPLTEENTVVEEPAAQYMATVVRVGNKRLNVRETASMNGKIIGHIHKGTTVEVIETGEEWHLIRFQDIEGYAWAYCLELTEIQEESTEER